MEFRFIGALMCSAVIIAGSAARAEVAAGFVLGEPTGFTVRVDKFPVLSFGWSLTHGWMYVNGDYWIIHKPLPPDAAQVNWYLGAGAALGLGGDKGFLGGRVPIGLQAIFGRNYELFGEVAPVVGLAPDVGLFLNVGIGFRFIF
jgi:hypothetical protein